MRLRRATEKRVLVGEAHTLPFLAKSGEVVCPVPSAYSRKHCLLSHEFMNIPDFGRTYRELTKTGNVRINVTLRSALATTVVMEKH